MHCRATFSFVLPHGNTLPFEELTGRAVARDTACPHVHKYLPDSLLDRPFPPHATSCSMTVSSGASLPSKDPLLSHSPSNRPSFIASAIKSNLSPPRL